jgi:peptidoglycan/xylan/chitin deacetylase (PgdA/CDA1 family)
MLNQITDEQVVSKEAPRTASDKIVILMYHSLDESGSVVSISPRDFADQISLLADCGFRGISLREALEYRSLYGVWPGKCAVITFDDGYANLYDCALPALSRYGFTSTIFIISGYMGGRNNWGPPPPGLGDRAILSWSQAAEMAAAGMEIGAHTRSHLNLERLSDDEARDEIVSSRIEIGERLDVPVESFAYPFGKVNNSHVEVARKEFKAACTTVLRRAGNEALHRLPRVDMYYIQSNQNLKTLLNGRLDNYLAIRRLGRTARRMLAPSR